MGLNQRQHRGPRESADAGGQFGQCKTADFALVEFVTEPLQAMVQCRFRCRAGFAAMASRGALANTRALNSTGSVKTT
jgi:hypothetical protein